MQTWKEVIGHFPSGQIFVKILITSASNLTVLCVHPFSKCDECVKCGWGRVVVRGHGGAYCALQVCSDPLPRHRSVACNDIMCMCMLEHIFHETQFDHIYIRLSNFKLFRIQKHTALTSWGPLMHETYKKHPISPRISLSIPLLLRNQYSPTMLWYQMAKA